MNKYDHAEVLGLYRELGSQNKVAQRLGMDQSHVSTILRRNGICVGKGKRRHDHERVLALFAELGNQHQVAAQLGMLPSTVSKIVCAAGIHIGKIGRQPVLAVPVDEVAQRYLAGETCRQIAADYDVDPEVVRMRLRRAGVKRRVGKADGPANPQWRGGRTQTMHYFRRQAYEVAAICLGQPLARGWVIHHCDENPQNNRPENLVLFRSQSAHATFHQRLLKRQRSGQPVDAIRLALESGAHVLPPPPRPIVFGPDTGPLAPCDNHESPAPGRPGSAPEQGTLVPR